MRLYNKYILPKAIHWACSQKPTMKQREKIIPLAYGNVLEIGIGSGLNLPFYTDKVTRLTAIDPSADLWQKNNYNITKLPFKVDFFEAIAENLPFDDAVFDCIVITYTMCTIPNIPIAFNEIKRVLKPTGELLFCEHGLSPQKNIQRKQHFYNPVWKKIGGGCNLNRDIPELLIQNGFIIENLNTMCLPGWKPASYNYWGVAKISKP